MTEPAGKRPDRPASRLESSASRFVVRLAFTLDALGVLVGIAALGWFAVQNDRAFAFPGMHPMGVFLNPILALPIHVVSLVALRARASGDDGELVEGWSACLTWFWGFAALLFVGQVLTEFGLTRTEPHFDVAYIGLALLPFFGWSTTLVALDARRVVSPKWWTNALFVPLLASLAVLTVSERAGDGIIGLLREPRPDDFGGKLTWEVENIDLIERMQSVPLWFALTWSLYVFLGVVAAARRAPRRTPETAAPHAGTTR